MSLTKKYDEELCWKEDSLPQKERMKYTHTIHPYFGKFVPHLVRYFLERHLKNAKLICDPFMGSGTTLIESNLAGIPSVGMDISRFNVMMCRVKTRKYDMAKLHREVRRIFDATCAFSQKTSIDNYVSDRQRRRLNPKSSSKFLNEWFHPDALHTLLVFRELIPGYAYGDVMKLILSRTARSSRMIAHYEVDYPKKPHPEDYFCVKHDRICHPTTDAFGFLKRYCSNTVEKIGEFQKVRNNVYTSAIHGDSRTYGFAGTGITDVFTSPPYLGLIDYHEQHRYAYELLGIKDNSENEIGAKKRGAGKSAAQEYKDGMTRTIRNITEASFDRKNGRFILVVHDKMNLYEEIVANSGLELVSNYYRKVDRRSGRRKGEFGENILVCKTAKP